MTKYDTCEKSPILCEDHMNMSFHGNQIEDIVGILVLKTFY